MRGQIWSLPPQELNGSPIEIAAWEVADSTYILLSADWFQAGNIVDCINGNSRAWYMTHQLQRGNLPLLEVVDHTDEEVIEAYVHSKIGTEAILIGLAAEFGMHPFEMMSAFQHWRMKDDAPSS